VDLVEAITVLVARIFAPAVTDGLVLIAPHWQTRVDSVLVSKIIVPLATTASMIGLIVFCLTSGNVRRTT
jgi:hypothetical protein